MEELVLLFNDQFGAQHCIEVFTQIKFAKKEAENYLYSIGNDCPVVSDLKIA